MTTTVHGGSAAGKLSRHFIPDAAGLSPAALFLIGVIAAVLHAKLRLGIGLPGHHGLEWMTALLFARCTSDRAWVAVVVALGASAGETVLATNAGHLAKAVPMYLLNAALVDLLYRATPLRLRSVPVAALIAALAYAAKPATMLGVAWLIDTEFGFMRHGTVFPILTHAAFGLIGGACGAILARGVYAIRRPGDPAAGTG